MEDSGIKRFDIKCLACDREYLGVAVSLGMVRQLGDEALLRVIHVCTNETCPRSNSRELNYMVDITNRAIFNQ